jgi:hypothetical protein
MSRLTHSSHRALALVCIALGTSTCAQDAADPALTPANQTAGCITSGDGSLEAAVRGALIADLDWSNAEMQCDGGPHPDGKGMRVTVAGPLPGTSSRLRFIFGIDPRDTASGVAQAFPTNLTLIVEGSTQLYATRGHDQCAVETLQRTPLAKGPRGIDRVKVRGYCIGPASDISGSTRVLVPTFSFTALLRTGDEP